MTSPNILVVEDEQNLDLLKKNNLKHWSKNYSIEAVKPVLDKIYALS